MSRKIQCTFFPNCIDEDECFFEHKEGTNGADEMERIEQNRYCTNGEKCSGHSCQFSERNHIDVKSVLIRFQANCNRRSCMYKYEVERKTFLVVPSPKLAKK